jgi:hypothetical protein
MAELCAVLPAEHLEAAMAHGAQMDLDEAVAEILGEEQRSMTRDR